MMAPSLRWTGKVSWPRAVDFFCDFVNAEIFDRIQPSQEVASVPVTA